MWLLSSWNAIVHDIFIVYSSDQNNLNDKKIQLLLFISVLQTECMISIYIMHSQRARIIWQLWDIIIQSSNYDYRQYALVWEQYYHCEGMLTICTVVFRVFKKYKTPRALCHTPLNQIQYKPFAIIVLTRI